MKTLIWSLVIGLVMMVGLNVDEAVAQSPPNIKVSVAFNPLKSQLPNRLLYLPDDPIEIDLTLQDLTPTNSPEEITSKGFSSKPFHLFLIFTDPGGRGIIAEKFEEGSTGDDSPPPPVIPVEVVPGRVELLQVEPVEKVNRGWVLTVTLPNVHAYYKLSKPGNYSVKAVIPMRTYLDIDHTLDSVAYSKIDRYKWKDALQSNTEHFTLLADADGDGYYFPEGWPPGAPADCDDNNLNDVPVATLPSPANGATNVSTTPTLSWNRVSCAINYRLQVANDSLFQSIVLDQNWITGTSYQVPSGLLSNSKTYYWRVNANSAGEISAWSLVWSFTTVAAAPAAPTLVSPTDGATGVSITPTFSWNASSGATSYRLQVSTTDTFSTTVFDQSGIAGTSKAVSGLVNNKKYYWHVNATNAGGTSGWSATWSFTTMATVPAAPTLLSPANNATGVSITPTLSWNASSGATSYRLQVSTKNDFTTTVFDQSGINGTSYTVPSGKLSANITYYWRVNATNAGGTSAWSSVRSFTTTTSKTYVLTVKIAGTGSGTVTASPLQPPLIWNGNIGTATYTAGTKVTLTAAATPNTGSTFTGWSAYCSGSGNCSVVISGSTCTVNMCGPCNATATFTIKTYTITATTAGTGGSISPKGTVKVNYGASQTFTITPDTKNRYAIADVRVDGKSVGAVSSYTFTNVTANHTIYATFKR
jgi:hypothetical protein